MKSQPSTGSRWGHHLIAKELCQSDNHASVSALFSIMCLVEVSQSNIPSHLIVIRSISTRCSFIAWIADIGPDERANTPMDQEEILSAFLQGTVYMVYISPCHMATEFSMVIWCYDRKSCLIHRRESRWIAVMIIISITCTPNYGQRLLEASICSLGVQRMILILSIIVAGI